MSNAIATTDVPKNPAIRRVWICGQLRIRGTSLRALALRAGVTHQAMSAALMAPNIHLEPAIAEAIGLTPQTLFPERFGAGGVRLTRTRTIQRSTRPQCDKVESAGGR